jgi:carbon monoxide dehydrogenase subunit G
MPKARRSRVIAADRRSVWDVVSDPDHRARWWPKVSRVEDVRERARGSGTQWTDVLTTASGKGVRAEFRCLWSRDLEGFAWEQKIEGTPFAKVLKSSVTQVALADSGPGTQVTLEADQKLRGMSRLGGFMLRRATGNQLDQALDGLEQAVGA